MPGDDRLEPDGQRGRTDHRSEREERPDLRIPAQPVAQPAETAPAQAAAQQAAPAAAPDASAMPVAPATQPAVTPAPAPVSAPVVAPKPVATAPVAAVPAGATPSVDRMPKVATYTLPTETLVDVAQSTGLQWVSSDSAKIAAVQAAIAAEPKPVHVPRVRPEPVSIDAGPLVLVETKRDLRNMTLPFEQPPAA